MPKQPDKNAFFIYVLIAVVFFAAAIKKDFKTGI